MPEEIELIEDIILLVEAALGLESGSIKGKQQDRYLQEVRRIAVYHVSNAMLCKEKSLMVAFDRTQAALNSMVSTCCKHNADGEYDTLMFARIKNIVYKMATQGYNNAARAEKQKEKVAKGLEQIRNIRIELTQRPKLSWDHVNPVVYG